MKEVLAVKDSQQKYASWQNKNRIPDEASWGLQNGSIFISLIRFWLNICFNTCIILRNSQTRLKNAFSFKVSRQIYK
jgi:hypothetical protein